LQNIADANISQFTVVEFLESWKQSESM